MAPLLLCIVLSAAPSPAPNPYLEEAKQLYQDLEYERALEALKRALSSPGTRSPDLAEIHVLRGLCHLQLGRDESGRGAFRAALLASPQAQLPPLTSPKIRAVFEAERKALPPPPTVSPPTPVAPQALPVAPLPTDPPPVEPAHVRWPAFATLGLAVAVACVGGVFGSLAQDLSHEADRAPFADDHLRLSQKAQERASLANGLFGAAAGLTVVGGVFFFVF